MPNQFDWSAKWAIYQPDKIAFKEYETGRTLTYSELNRLGNRFAHYLVDTYNFRKGDRIAVLAENCLEYLVLFTAMQKTGGIMVPLNYRLANTEMDYLIGNADPKLVLFENKYQQKIDNLTHFTQRSLQNLSVLFDPDQTDHQDSRYLSVSIREEDPIFILYTSGTTGFPKGALYTHKMLFWNSINTAISLIINGESRTVNCMPPFHTGGWNVLTTPFFHHGGYTCLMKSFDAATVLQLLEEEQVTIFMGVPTMLRLIAEQEQFETTNLSSLHYIIVGGEPMPTDLIEKWHNKQVPIRQGFGMTEVGPNLTSLHQRDAVKKMGSIGLPNFYVETKIVDEQGKVCPSGQAGELLLKGPMVTPGYWRDEASTKSSFSDGWFKTGDRVQQDKEGYLFVVDRIKNMYISGGENVYPAEVERVLMTHPVIDEAAVVGFPDKKWGECGRAFLVTSETIDELEIKEYCSLRLAKFKVPKYIVFLDALPKNDTGKVDRKKLKERN